MNLRSKWLRQILLPAVVLVVAAAALPGAAQQMDLNTVGEPVQPMPVDPAIVHALQMEHVHNGVYQKSADGSYMVTVPVSKDNAIFGVEAVGAHGQRSTAVVPMPTR